MARSYSSRVSADLLRRSAGAVGRGGQVRADAAVARQGLSAAGGTQARNVPPGRPAGDGAAGAPRWSQRIPRAARSKIDGQPGTARSARP